MKVTFSLPKHSNIKSDDDDDGDLFLRDGCPTNSRKPHFQGLSPGSLAMTFQLVEVRIDPR